MPLESHILYGCSQRRCQMPCVCPGIERWHSECLLPLCTPGGDQRLGCGDNLFAMQESSDCSYHNKWCWEKQWKRDSLCKSLLSVFQWYPACNFRLHHKRAGTSSLTFPRHWPYPRQWLKAVIYIHKSLVYFARDKTYMIELWLLWSIIRDMKQLKLISRGL